MGDQGKKYQNADVSANIRDLLKHGNTYMLLWRSITDDEIFKKPPLYLKIFIWFLCKAFYEDDGNLKRGQFKTSTPEILEAMTYWVGARVEKPTARQVRTVLDYLKTPKKPPITKGTLTVTPKVTQKEPTIVTTKVTHGIIVTIANYDKYQFVTSPESHHESHPKLDSECHSDGQGGGHNNKIINSNNSLSSTSPKSGKRKNGKPLKKEYVPDETETKLLEAFVALIKPAHKGSRITVESQAPTLWRILYGKDIRGSIDELRLIYKYFVSNPGQLEYLPSFQRFEQLRDDGSQYKYHFWLGKAEKWKAKIESNEDEH
jgi:hypothetical protein